MLPPDRRPSPPRPALLASLLALLLGLAGLAAVPSASAASSTYLCTGYVACSKAGYPSGGYRTEGSKMWWRMYAGHNCTNYVAYRLVKSGASSERPWSGSGNATNWGVALSGLVDQTPRVGAVAWYKANGGWAGSSGHVAYVEEVVSATQILVSEDNWGGDFDWRVVTKGTNGWPDGFIHVNDTPLEVVSEPVVSGDVAVGETLNVDPGSYAEDADVSVRWFAAGTRIKGATGLTFTPTVAQWKKRLSVRVVAKATGYARTVIDTDRTHGVRRGTIEVTTDPVVTGTAQVDQVLTTSLGRYSPAAAATKIAWYADGTRVRGESGRTLTVTPDLVDTRITAKVAASTEAYKVQRATTSETKDVAPGVIRLDDPFGLDGRAELGDALTVAPGTVSWPTDADVSYEWLRGQTTSNARSASSTDGSGVSEDSLTYTLGTRDVGKQVGVRVTVSRPGYTTEEFVLRSGSLTTTSSVLDLDATPRVRTREVRVKGTQRTRTVVNRKVVVNAGVEAPGRKVVNGAVRATLTLADGTQQVVEGTLEDSTVRLVLTNVPRGKQKIRVDYLGTKIVEASAAKVTVRVPRR
ncbi:CHAP domain-containing protein [Nocardioides bruguierae]|uniref:CHAP domain-containing protein n=1 Tax=Nocardioides bruguierae TaxID=2945102 RepID=UPI0020221C7C|nr:CHAP domain-containing protein [Nocardioides bruguierae]MCL8025541.1 CHAP domain-containing protein [Nocardioides bruguierae]